MTEGHCASNKPAAAAKDRGRLSQVARIKPGNSWGNRGSLKWADCCVGGESATLPDHNAQFTTERTMPTDTQLDFYFDFISPYAYLGWQHVKRLRAEGVDVRLRPVVFAGLLREHGQLGPAEIPAKRRFVIRDCMRLAHHLGVAFTFPAKHPFRSVDALRLCLLTRSDQQALVVDSIFNATWRDGRDVADLEQLGKVVGDAGLDGDAMVDQTRHAGIKQALEHATEAAIQRGVFGVPTFGVGDELVWGHDRIGDVRALLAGEDVVEHAVADELESRPTGVVRKRKSNDQPATTADLPAEHVASGLSAPASKRVRELFSRASFVRSLGIEPMTIAAGVVWARMPVSDEITQQDGYVHAGALATFADHTAGAAGATVMPLDRSPLSIEFKINMLRPALGPELTCEAKVLQAGRRIVIIESWVYGGDDLALVAKATVTLKAARL